MTTPEMLQLHGDQVFKKPYQSDDMWSFSSLTMCSMLLDPQNLPFARKQRSGVVPRVEQFLPSC